MNGGSRPGCRIDKKNGNAVGGLHPEEEARPAGGRSVAAAGFGWRGVEDVGDVGMKLLERDKRKIGCAESRLEAAAIFENIFTGVPVGEAEA